MREPATREDFFLFGSIAQLYISNLLAKGIKKLLNIISPHSKRNLQNKIVVVFQTVLNLRIIVLLTVHFKSCAIT